MAALLLLPAVHPLLRPVVGVPSHLLWWMHVLSVAMVVYRHGERSAIPALSASALLVVAGERLFGAGYGTPADWFTISALAAALTFTNALVAGFAVYARRAALRYQILFEGAVTGIVRVGSDLEVEAANSAALRLLDVEWDEIARNRFSDIPWLNSIPEPEEIQGHGWTGAVCLRSGQEVHLSIVSLSQDEPRGYQLLLVDRTHEVAQEREMERQTRLATLGETLAGVAHELNNPLTVVGAWAELASAPAATRADVREGLAVIREQAERMRSLVSELLGFSRTAAPEDRVSLGEFVSRVVRVQRLTRGKHVRFVERIEWLGEVCASSAKVEQILVNLLSNAVCTVPHADGVVDIGVRQQGADALVEVSDNGPGLDPSLYERIFEPFWTTKAAGEGTGLGLAISRSLATSMGGSLEVGAAPGGGARFTLRLPLAGTAMRAILSTETVAA